MLVKLRRHRIGVVIGMSILVLLIAGVVTFTDATIDSVKVTGNHFYSEEDIQKLLFGDSLENNTIICYLNNRLGKVKEIPFIERYQIEVVDKHRVEVIVYEKNIVGFIHYMGSYMYFDRDGTVVESSSEQMEGICELKGLTFSKIALGKTIEADIPGLFDEVLLMTQLFEKYQMQIDAIQFDQRSRVSVQNGSIRVELGNMKDMDLKINEMYDIMPDLKGLKGTLYLDNIEIGTYHNGTYVFKVAKEEETEEEPVSVEEETEEVISE